MTEPRLDLAHLRALLDRLERAEAEVVAAHHLLADAARYVWHDTLCDNRAPSCRCGVLSVLRRFPNRPTEAKRRD